ncbi:MAG TPA: Mur ligase domain-containing protein [Polyangia bacterium]|nr:Mur ligase domain-containing protein [Polyangia bacterium]
MATLRLSDLLEGVPGVRVQGNARTPIKEVRDDSRLVGPGDLFVAVAGTKEDGRRFIEAAVEKGAAAVLAEGEPPPGIATFVAADSVRRALGKIAANRYGAAKDLTLTAVTGTSGKTTMTYLMESILAAAGRRPGVVGTVTYRYPGKA